MHLFFNSCMQYLQKILTVTLPFMFSRNVNRFIAALYSDRYARTPAAILSSAHYGQICIMESSVYKRGHRQAK